MTGFRNFNNSTCKTVLNLLEEAYLRFWEVVVQRITVIKFVVEVAVVQAVVESR